MIAEIARDVIRLSWYGREVPEIRATTLADFHAELARVTNDTAIEYYLSALAAKPFTCHLPTTL